MPTAAAGPRRGTPPRSVRPTLPSRPPQRAGFFGYLRNVSIRRKLISIILLTTSALSSARAVIAKLPFDPVKDFTPIASVGVMLMSMSANHDTAVMADADRFDIEREVPDGWHLLTFGGGIHYCLGANLARLELTEALAELATRCETLSLAGPSVMNPPGSVKLVWPQR